MPTYEYRCKDCDHEFEAQQSFTDEPLSTCPSCGGAVRKKFSSVGISFKGSGFYKTDSRSSSSGEDAASNGSSSAGEASGSGSSPGAGSSGGGSSGGSASGSSAKESVPS
jgi:putative FmdB family regulatory protein